MRVYFVRHGESVSNASRGKIRSDDPAQGDRLSELGWEQARGLGRRLKGEGLTKIITSDMVRAKETAEGINEVLNLPLDVRPGIQEIRQADAFYRHYGPDRAQFSSVVWMGEYDDPDYRLDEAESFNQVVKRVTDLQQFLVQTKDEQLVVVSHGNFLRFFLGVSMLRKEFRPRHFQSLWNILAANTGITVFDYDAEHLTADGFMVGGWRLVTWMDSSHL